MVKYSKIMQELCIDKINMGNGDITAVDVIEAVNYLNRTISDKIIPYNMLDKSYKVKRNNAFFHWMLEESSDATDNKNKNKSRKIVRSLNKVYKTYIEGKKHFFQGVSESNFYDLLKVFYYKEEVELYAELQRIKDILSAMFSVIAIADWQWEVLYKCALTDNKDITRKINAEFKREYKTNEANK